MTSISSPKANRLGIDERVDDRVDVRDDEVGSASGTLNAVQQLGGALGVAVLGTLFFSAAAAHGFLVAFERTLWVESAVGSTTKSALCPDAAGRLSSAAYFRCRDQWRFVLPQPAGLRARSDGCPMR